MRLFSRAEFARLAGVTGAAVTKVAKKWAADAIVHGRVNADHPDPRGYLASKGVTDKAISTNALAPTKAPKTKRKRPALPTERRGRPPKAKPSPPEARPLPVPEPSAPAPVDAGSVEDEQLAESPSDEILEKVRSALVPIVGEFGSSRRMADWVDVAKGVEDLISKRLSNEQTRGRLIRRDLVRNSVFSVLDALALKLLRDAPRTLASEVYALCKSDAPLEDGEMKIRKYVEKIFEPTKDSAVKALRDPTGA